MKFIALTPASTSWKLRGFALTHVIPNVYHLLGNRVSVCTTFFLDALNLLTPIIKLWPTVLCNDRGEVMTVTLGQGVDGGRIPNPDDLLLLLHLFHICSRARSVSTISYNTTSFPYFCPISLLIHNYSSHIDSPPLFRSSPPIVGSSRSPHFTLQPGRKRVHVKQSMDHALITVKAHSHSDPHHDSYSLAYAKRRPFLESLYYLWANKRYQAP